MAVAKQARVLILIAIAVLFTGAVLPADALALRYQSRPNWMAGVGWGMGKGTFQAPDGSKQEYSEGGVALIRVGRMIGSKAMVALNYSGWLIEFTDTTKDWVPESGHDLFASDPEDSTVLKNRRSQQQLALSLYWFPGNPAGASGGAYLRGGIGMAWAGTNEVLIEADNPQGHGSRIDEWGWGLSAEGGYEFWISSHAALGAAVFYNYTSTQETIVDNGWFTGASLVFNIYF
jgi:hypothetical protein